MYILIDNTNGNSNQVIYLLDTAYYHLTQTQPDPYYATST